MQTAKRWAAPALWWAAALLLLVLLACGAEAQSAAQLQAIRDDNHARRNKGRAFSGAIYWLICMGAVALALITSILLGWFFLPLKGLLRRHRPQWSDEKIIRTNTGVWAVATLLLSFILLAAGGLPGWIVVNFLFSMVCCSVGVVACVVLRGSKSTPRSVPTRVAPSQADEQPSQPKDLTKARPAGVTEHPEPVGRHQTVAMVALLAVLVLMLVIVLILFYSWSVSDYQLWSLAEGKAITEYIPPTTAKAILLLYSYEGLASNLRCQVFTRIGTTYCGNHFTMKLSDDQKRKALYEPFVDRYKIDMSIYTPADWTKYDSVNDWFIRKINASARPAPQPRTNASVVVAPADSRMLVFTNSPDLRLWVKERSFTVADLLDGDRALASEFVNGMIVIARLAPQDYHRFNTNMYGVVQSVKNVDGTYWSVNPDAIVSQNNAFFNARQIVVIQNTRIGKVAYVAIGATCVGSVIIGPQPGDRVTLGDELGYMQFGGSTVLLLFQAGMVRFDQRLVTASKVPVETYVTINSIIGEAMT